MFPLGAPPVIPGITPRRLSLGTVAPMYGALKAMQAGTMTGATLGPWDIGFLAGERAGLWSDSLDGYALAGEFLNGYGWWGFLIGSNAASTQVAGHKLTQAEKDAREWGQAYYSIRQGKNPALAAKLQAVIGNAAQIASLVDELEAWIASKPYFPELQPRSTQAPVQVPPPKRFRQFLQVVYTDAVFTPGVGMKTPPQTLAWREIQQEVDAQTGTNVINPLVAFGKWVGWKTGYVGSTGGETVQAWNINSVPNGDMSLANWDMPGLQTAIQSGSSSPPSMDWSEIKHSGNLGPQAAPQTPHADPDTSGQIPPGIPATVTSDGRLVPLVVALNTPSLFEGDDNGAPAPLPNPADGIARFGQGLGLVIVGLVGWYLWNKRR